MKILTTGNSTRTNYPLGSEMKDDLPIINALIEKYKEIKEYKNKQVNLFCTGSSGAIMATLFMMNIPFCEIIHIKKEGENSHQNNNDRIINTTDTVNIIIDDFICTGTSVERVAKFMETEGIEINCLIISGCSNHSKYSFTTDYIICGKNDK